jgi:hypothetical protein
MRLSYSRILGGLLVVAVLAGCNVRRQPADDGSGPRDAPVKLSTAMQKSKKPQGQLPPKPPPPPK